MIVLLAQGRNERLLRNSPTPATKKHNKLLLVPIVAAAL